MKFWACMTCGHLTEQANSFCNYCSSPLPTFLHSPEQSQILEGVLLGHLENGVAFHLPLNFASYGFYGITGVGKTTLAMRLAVDAENSGLKLFVLDPEGEWKNIIPNLKGRTEYYATLHNLKVNPFDLNDKGLIRLLLKETVFQGVETEYWDLSPQMNYVLDQCIEKSNSIPQLIENISYFDGKDLPFKLVNIERTKTALIVRLSPYKNNEVVKEIFYCDKSSIDLNRLDDRNIIFDLHELESKVAYGTEVRLLYNVLSIAALRQAMARPVTDTITNMLIADEAQLLVPKILRKVLAIDTWPTTEFATRLRKRGQSIVIISQSPSNIEDDIRRNIQNNFVFRLQSPEDIRLIAGMLGCSHHVKVDHFGHRLSNLKPRQAIVKTPIVDEPFIITSMEVSLRPISADELQNYSPKIPIDNKPLLPKPKEDLSDEEKLFLQSIDKEPFISTRQRRHSLGWNEEKYGRIVEGLIQKGMIEKVSAPTGRGRPLVLYQTKGKNPSVKHEYYVHWLVSQFVKKGLTCTAEKVGPDIRIPKLKTAINVELGSSEIRSNISKALEQFDKLIVCSDDVKVLEAIRSQIKPEEGKRVFVHFVWDVPSLFGVDAV